MQLAVQPSGGLVSGSWMRWPAKSVFDLTTAIRFTAVGSNRLLEQ